jgi:hypothetical protein
MKKSVALPRLKAATLRDQDIGYCAVDLRWMKVSTCILMEAKALSVGKIDSYHLFPDSFIK